MKVLNIVIGIVIMAFAISSFGQVDIQKVPLTWKQARITEGGELFVVLCSVCHGKSGKGDGPASTALKKKVPDLTILSKKNSGKFPFDNVEAIITGKSRIISHGTVDMPIWGDTFEGVRPQWKMFRRKSMAKQRIHSLTEYISTIQTNQKDDGGS
jgi:mono/diheme cytochrome c family protein